MHIYQLMQQELDLLQAQGNLRALNRMQHEGRYIASGQEKLLNLASNDYLGIAADIALRQEFLDTLDVRHFVPSASASRLMTGNFPVFEELEHELAGLYHREAALLFDCGYHANTGILPAIARRDTLILADKLVHASLIDGIKLAGVPYYRYRHNDMQHLEKLLQQHAGAYDNLIIVTESLFSMDGDEAPLARLVSLKERYPHVLLYLDEAHAFGVRGARGLGCAEEADCIPSIDFLVGTLGKAAASAGAFVVCNRLSRDFLINKVHPFIYTTALPPVVVAWSLFVIRRLGGMADRRRRLAFLSEKVHQALISRGRKDLSTSHIIPLLVGESDRTVTQAGEMRRRGIHALPVRPPTVPEGSARIRISLRADLTDEEINHLIDNL